MTNDNDNNEFGQAKKVFWKENWKKNKLINQKFKKKIPKNWLARKTKIQKKKKSSKKMGNIASTCKKLQIKQT